MIEREMNATRGSIVDSLLAEELKGWSSYLYEQVEQLHRADQAQIFNFPYLSLPASEILEPLEVYQAWLKKEEMKKHAAEPRRRPTHGSSYQSTADKEDEQKPDKPLEYPEGGLLSLEHNDASDTFVFCDFLQPGVQSVLVFDPQTK